MKVINEDNSTSILCDVCGEECTDYENINGKDICISCLNQNWERIEDD